MSLYFYPKREANLKNDSIIKYKDIFKTYIDNPPKLKEALIEMYSIINISIKKRNALVENILTKSKEIIDKNFKIIKEKYPFITFDDSLIISSYTYINCEYNYSPFIILNNQLNQENTYEKFTKISKYLYLFLQSLRKLDKFIPQQKYLFKYIDRHLNLKETYFNQNEIIYKKGITKIFWGFASFSPSIKKSYFIDGKEKIINEGTILTLYGDIYGYDISLFNSDMEEEIILEPGQKCLVINAVPPINNKFTNIRIRIVDNNNIITLNHIFENYSSPKFIKIVYTIPKINERINLVENYIFTLNLKQEKKYYSKIRIFGKDFVENNKKNCSFIYKNIEYDLVENFEFSDLKENDTEIEIYLKGFETITNLKQLFAECKCLYSFQNDIDLSKIVDISEMFKNCSQLETLPNISVWNTKNVHFMNYLFFGCKSLKSLPDISKWDTSNVLDMNHMFSECSKLTSLPDISKWDISNVIDFSYMFSNCSKLQFLPDISKWKISKAKNISYLFNYCISLGILPDISNWDISNVLKMEFLFNRCFNLKYLPDISVWNTSKVENIMFLFGNCSSLVKLPDISKWNTSNIKNMDSLFYNCTSLTNIPDISKWNISNAKNISSLFENCRNLENLPDISKWNTSNIKYINSLFKGCSKLLCLPDISKWKFTNLHEMKFVFADCTSIKTLPDISVWNTSTTTNMNSMFENCISLLILPDISKWNTFNVEKFECVFKNCKSLSKIPDISKWKASPDSIDHMFEGCSSLVSLPNILKMNLNNVVLIDDIFNNCISLSYIPFIYKRNRNKKKKKNKNLINDLNIEN